MPAPGIESKRLSIAGRLATSYSRAVISPRFASVVLAAIIVWEFLALLFRAKNKRFWYDELVTFHLSALQPFSRLQEALRVGADSMPRGYYMLVRLARMLPGDPLLTLRLPSIFGYLLCLLGIYWFATKKLPVLAGLMAVILITLSPFRGYAIETRSYALMMGFIALSLAAWQRIGDRQIMTPIFALLLALAVACHPLAVVTIACFAAAEVASTILSRKVRWGAWAAFLIGACPFFVELPTLTYTRSIYAAHFWARPSWSTVFLTYSEYLGFDAKPALALVVLIAIVLGRLLRKSWRANNGTPVAGFSAPELVLIGAFLVYPAFLIMLIKLGDAGYTGRYGWPGLLGLALGIVCVVQALSHQSSFTRPFTVLLIAFAVRGALHLTPVSQPHATLTDGQWTGLIRMAHDEPDLPVLIASGHSFLDEVDYGPAELHDRVFTVADRAAAVRLTGSDSLDLVNGILARFTPLQVEAPAAFLAAHQRFILRSGGDGDWFTRYLLEKNYRLTLRSQETDSLIYIAEKEPGQLAMSSVAGVVSGRK